MSLRNNYKVPMYHYNLQQHKNDPEDKRNAAKNLESRNKAKDF